MKLKTLAIPALAAAIAIAPLTSASAYDRWHGGGRHWGGGPVLGLLALGTAAVVGVAAIATAPFNAIAAAGPAPEPYYQPAPQPAYYAPQPAYYYPQPRVVYAQPGYYYR